MAKLGIHNFNSDPVVSLYIIYNNSEASIPLPQYPFFFLFFNHQVVILSQEEDFQDMIDLAETIENQCAHMFDKVIVNGDIAVAFRELKADLERLKQEEIQWIPAEWAGSSSAAAAWRSCGHLGGWI